MRHCIMKGMVLRAWVLPAALAAMTAGGAAGQVIQFESGGLKYQTLSRDGVTVMFAHLPAQLHDYAVLQVGISNGSDSTCTVRPEDFVFQRVEGERLPALTAKRVVDHLLERATRSDVIHLISTYESTLNGVSRFRSTNGYEQRRQSALAELGGNKLSAAAAASAIALVQTTLRPGESTDGAIFFSTGGKPLGVGRLLASLAGRIFEFESDPPSSGKALQRRGPAAEPQPGP